MDIAVRIVKMVAGFGLLGAGFTMLVIPGPGWLTIAAGLAMLSSEFPWARSLLDRLKATAARAARLFRGRNLDGAQATESDRPGRH